MDNCIDCLIMIEDDENDNNNIYDTGLLISCALVAATYIAIFI
jgi:hypothetical protein